MGRQEKRDPEDDQEPLNDEVEQSDSERAQVQSRAAGEPDTCDRSDQPAGDERVPRRIA